VEIFRFKEKGISHKTLMEIVNPTVYFAKLHFNKRVKKVERNPSADAYLKC
jgi:hypothetical protein